MGDHMNDEQRYHFDTWGFLTIEDAITPEQVTELKAGADENSADLGSQLKKNGGFWSQAYVDLLDVPVISEMLDEMYGGPQPNGLPAFRIDHINIHTHGVFNKELAGGTIHNCNQRRIDPGRPRELQILYSECEPESGAFENGLIAVAYELEDTVCNDGGFCCIPGSHKANFGVPPDWVDLSQGVHPMMTRVPARAGTAIIFTEALSHGTLPWTAPSTRTTLFYKYTHRNEAYSGSERFFDPADADGWQRADDRKRAILTPPPQSYVERKAELSAQRA